MKLKDYILNYLRLMLSGLICLSFLHWGWALRDYGFDLYQYYGVPCLALLVFAPLLLLFFSGFLLFVKERFYDNNQENDKDDASGSDPHRLSIRFSSIHLRATEKIQSNIFAVNFKSTSVYPGQKCPGYFNF